MGFERKSFFVRALRIFVLLSILFTTASASAADAPMSGPGPFQKTDRVLILAPHPDDETIGCAGIIMRALKAGARVKVVYLTCGDNNIFSILFYNPLTFPFKLFFLRRTDFINLGKERERESVNAMKILGVDKKDLTFLGYPDHGTDKIFIHYWGSKKPYKSMLSEQTEVPYRESGSYKKEFKADNILSDLKKLILEYKPTKIFISHAADFNGDHWALYLYSQVVFADLLDEMPQPQVYSYLVHVPDWPLPRHYHPELKLEPPPIDFFSDLSSEIQWSQLQLTPGEIEKKHEAMLAYKTQTHISAFYLLAFVRQNELFSDLPLIELKRQYTSGPLASQGGSYSFTGDNQWIKFAVVDNYLLLKAKKPRELKSRASFVFFIAGYKYGMYFGDMPNISITTKYDKFSIYNTVLSKSPIDPKDTSLQFAPESVILKIPLSLLGDPDAFIFAFHSPGNKFLPGGCSAFRRVVIKE